MAPANLCCFCCTIDTADVSAGTCCVWSSSGWLFVDGPDSCWSREWHGLASQPGGLYCEMCYLKWGLYVKPGQQYELSPSCEALALSVGVKFLKKPKHKSNPFLCICGRVFNTGNLETHLRAFHANQYVQHSDEEEQYANEVQTYILEQVVHVSDCSDSRLNGTYLMETCNHGKPVYEKEIASAADVNAFIYFWDDRDGKSLCGWWMGPVVGSAQVWAFNHGHHSKENLMLPTRGWKVPWYGAVDIDLEVISDASKKDSKVKSLLADVARLERFLSDHVLHMVSQESWRTGRQLMNVRQEIPATDEVYKQIEKALRLAHPADHHSMCRGVDGLVVTKLEQISNIRLWKNYEFRMEQVRQDMQNHPPVSVASNLSSQACSWMHCDPLVNEVLAIHGTLHQNLDQIAQFGFDQRLARQGGLYGQGVYFTDQSCKSLQYSGSYQQETGCFILARLILGCPHFATGPMSFVKVEPLQDPTDSSKGRCHSVIANPGLLTGMDSTQVHREFVIFDGAQAYPEMIVHFQIR